MNMKSKILSIFLTAAMVFSLIPARYFDLDTAAAADEAFRITSVQVINERVAIVHLSNEMGTHFQQYALAHAAFLTYYLKLDGQYLHNDLNIAVGAASRIYTRDDKKSFELVLGSSTTTGEYNGPKFKPGGGTLQFDFENREFTPISQKYGGTVETTQSGDTWIRDSDDNPMSQDVFNYTASGTLAAAPLLAVENIKILDSRAIYVKFNQRIPAPENNSGSSVATTGLHSRPYIGGTAAMARITGVVGDANVTLNSMYSYSLDASASESDGTGEGREFIIYYDGDFVDNGAYSYTWQYSDGYLAGLVNRPGQNSTPTLTGTVAKPTGAIAKSDYRLDKAELIESASGKFELELTFNRPFAYTKIAPDSRFRTANLPNIGTWAAKLYDVKDGAGNIVLPGAADYNTYDVDANRTYYQTLAETGVGMCGTVLTVDDLKEMLTLTGVKAGGEDFLNAFPGDEVIAYFKNSHTIVIHNQNRLPITLDAGANVTIKAEALVGYGTRGNWATRNVGTPATGLTQDTVGYMSVKTNGLRNSQITAFPITKRAAVTPFAKGYDPNWTGGVKATETVVRFGHGDYDYFQYDGIRDPMVGGTDSKIRHGLNVNSNASLQSVGMSGSNKQNYYVQDTYKAVTLENKYIKATFAEPAARFLYFIFKPTGHDAFYTNPTGVIYGQGSPNTHYPPAGGSEGTFVIGWLMVWGGTFPVFDGCEHARIWSTCFPFNIINNTDGSVTVKYEIKDDLTWAPILGSTYVPSSTNTSMGGRFQPYAVNVEYTFEYTVKPNSPVVDMTVTVHNPTKISRTYEYYTCNTLAPGEVSEWGSGTMKHFDNVQLLMSQGYAQMYNVNQGEVSNDRTSKDVRPYSSFNAATADAKDNDGNYIIPQQVRDYIVTGTRSDVHGSVDREHYYRYDTMRYIMNHGNSTNFATDLARLPQADWYGGVNQSNLEGIMRSGTDLMKATPTIKYWLWSYSGMFNTLPFERSAGSSARPYLEPWAGVGTQYFHNRSIDAGETQKWTESYYHTFGLTDATNSTPEATALLKFYRENGGYRAAANLYATRLEKNLRAVLRTDSGTVLRDYPYTSKIMAHEAIEATSLVPAGTKVWLELYDGTEKIFDAWAVQGQTFEVDRTAPVTEVIISHGKTTEKGKYEIDIPGRTTASPTKYHLREIYAYSEPFAAEGQMRVYWTPLSGDIGEVLLTSGAGGPGGTGITTPNNNSWWHSFDYTTIRGLTPGKSVTFRATSKDENIVPAGSVYADLKVNVKEPLYLEVPNNPGITSGYGTNMYSPYHFNVDMVLPLTITKHDDGVVSSGPINIEIYDMFNEQVEPYISFQVTGLGVKHELKIPANTLPRQDYYKIVAKTASGDALGYEYFRVDGYTQILWHTTKAVSGDNLTIRFIKFNANVVNTMSLVENTAYINGVPYTVSLGSTNANYNLLTITGARASLKPGLNEIEVPGIQFASFPGYTFAFTDDYDYAG